MTKEEFLTKLEKRLEILHPQTRKKVLSRFEKKLDTLIQSGLSEKDAVSSLGNMKDIVKEILEEYHINTDYHDKDNFSLNDFVNALVKKIKGFLTDVFNGSIEELLNLVLKVIILLIILALLHLPFSLIKQLVIYLLNYLPSVVSHIFIIGWKVFIEFSYIIISTLIVISNLKNDLKYFKNLDKNNPQTEIDNILNECSKQFKKALRIIYNIFLVIFSIPLLFFFILAIIFISLLVTLFAKGVFLFGTILFLIGITILIFAIFLLIFQSIRIGDKE